MGLCETVFVFLIFVSGFQCSVGEHYQQHASDNEFAEFEEFEDDEISIEDMSIKSDPEEIDKESPFLNDDSDISIEDAAEFEHFHDVEEFEGFELKEDGKPSSEPEITIAKVPVNFRQNWDSYYLEVLMILGLTVYFINFLAGRNKNNKIAKVWIQTHRQLLEDNFSLVGDDGTVDNNDNVNLIKESENVFTLWCSGRVCCEGMLVELKLIKRQDLLTILSGMIRPTLDQIHITVKMNKEDMDNYIFCIASKKTAQYLCKEMADISVFCSDRKAGEKYNLTAGFSVMSEIAEATSAMLDSKMLTVINKYSEYIDYIHFSDQFSGPKQTDDGASLKMPDTEKVLIFGFNIDTKGLTLEETMLKMTPLMNMVFYCIDRVKRFRLSKEGKAKSEKNRQRVEEAFLKSTHQARAEAAAAKREDKRRQEKERVMAEEDPERQRRWEIKEEKRQAKKRAPKMKQLKVKAL